jgi:hypothetical protein
MIERRGILKLDYLEKGMLMPHSKCLCYIHSLKDRKNDCNVLGEATILEKIEDNLYIAEYNGIRCTAIFNPFVGRYFVDDVYGILDESKK